MTQLVADDVLGKLGRQYNDLFRRVRDGSLNAGIVFKQMQDTIQANFSPSQIPPWKVVEQRRLGGACAVDAALSVTNYSFPERGVRLQIGIGSEEWDITLVRLLSSDLKAKGENVCTVCEKAQALGLTLCWPEVSSYLCLQYELQPGEHLFMPIYGFSSKSDDPGQCAEFRYSPCGGGGRHEVTGADLSRCGVGEDLEWIFQSSKEYHVR